MRVRSVAVVVCALIATAADVLQGPAASAGSDEDRAADRAAIEKGRQQDTFTAAYVDSPGSEAKQIRGTVLCVWKKLPDGSWKVFRALGDTSQ
jgi:ketosteroid isomerase-like protein